MTSSNYQPWGGTVRIRISVRHSLGAETVLSQVQSIMVQSIMVRMVVVGGRWVAPSLSQVPSL